MNLLIQLLVNSSLESRCVVVNNREFLFSSSELSYQPGFKYLLGLPIWLAVSTDCFHACVKHNGQKILSKWNLKVGVVGFF